ncbi:WD40/YVTN/BNR-like repeat-containing protein [Massilia niabensis]|uniref:WD40/YVTN/BNR-like repeat-containing protein n=1 Tax=Massilia niabensis TaxID=544910 RepID=A0ABW0L6A0_9BURK
MHFKRLILALAVACSCAAAPAAAASTAPVADPVMRPAQMVRQPAKAYLTGVTQAGKRIVAVGERGIIILSDDGGASWRQAKVPVSVTLAAVQFPTPTHGWAVGHYGVILHSRDGGESWTRQMDGTRAAQLMLRDAQAQPAAGGSANEGYLAEAQRLVADGPDKPFLDLYFKDAQNGVVVGAYNLAFRTRDGGKTWTPFSRLLDNPRGNHMYAIRASGDDVYIAGEQGLLLRSTDGGQRFERIELPYKGSFFALGLIGGQVTVAGLGGNALRSGDRGASWEKLAVPLPVSITAMSSVHGGTLLMANQAGMLLRAAPGKPLAALKTPPLAPLSDVLVQPDGAIVTVGMSGAVRLPAPSGPIHDPVAAK